MQGHGNNRPRLDDIRAMPAGEIVKLPAEHLALLQEDAGARTVRAAKPAFRLTINNKV